MIHARRARATPQIQTAKYNATCGPSGTCAIVCGVCGGRREPFYQLELVGLLLEALLQGRAPPLPLFLQLLPLVLVLHLLHHFLKLRLLAQHILATAERSCQTVTKVSANHP